MYVQGGTGWWKHEFCYGKKIIQYHEVCVLYCVLLVLEIKQLVREPKRKNKRKNKKKKGKKERKKGKKQEQNRGISQENCGNT